jgi:hypothetical protein
VVFGWPAAKPQSGVASADDNPGSAAESESAAADILFQLSQHDPATLCAQDLFGTFLARLLDGVKLVALPLVTRIEHTSTIQITHDAVDRLVSVFTKQRLGSEAEALTFLAPSLWYEPPRELFGQIFELVLEAQRQLVIAGRWRDAIEAVQRAWELFAISHRFSVLGTDSLTDDEPCPATFNHAKETTIIGNIHHRILTLSLCEIYRMELDEESDYSAWGISQRDVAELGLFYEQYARDMPMSQRAHVSDTICNYEQAFNLGPFVRARHAIHGIDGPSESYTDDASICDPVSMIQIWMGQMSPSEKTAEVRRNFLHSAMKLDLAEMVLMVFNKPSGWVFEQKEGMPAPPLSMAAEAGAQSTILMLLEAGADANLPCERGIIPLAAAAGRLDFPVFRHLLSKTKIEFLSSQAGADCALAIARDGTPEEVAAALGSGDMRFAMEKALERDESRTIKALVPCNRQRSIGWLTHLASRPDLARKFLDTCPEACIDYDPDRDRDPCMLADPFINAVRAKNEELTQLLLDHGVSLLMHVDAVRGLPLRYSDWPEWWRDKGKAGWKRKEWFRERPDGPWQLTSEYVGHDGRSNTDSMFEVGVSSKTAPEKKEKQRLKEVFEYTRRLLTVIFFFFLQWHSDWLKSLPIVPTMDRDDERAVALLGQLTEKATAQMKHDGLRHFAELGDTDGVAEPLGSLEVMA